MRWGYQNISTAVLYMAMLQILYNSLCLTGNVYCSDIDYIIHCVSMFMFRCFDVSMFHDCFEYYYIPVFGASLRQAQGLCTETNNLLVYRVRDSSKHKC